MEITPTNILLFLVVFVFIRYFIKDSSVLFFLIVSFVCVNYFSNNKNKNKISYKDKITNKKEQNRIVLGDNLEKIIDSIKKYDSHNLVYIIKKNIKNLYRNINKKNGDRIYIKNDIDTILYLKQKILRYITELNMNYDDAAIDNAVVAIKKILEKDISKFRDSLGGGIYRHFFTNIEGFNPEY